MQTRDTISATLGSQQLQIGLIAGLIGLILVVDLLADRVPRARLPSSSRRSSSLGVLTYIVISILSLAEGFRLSLAGVAGLIVAIGFTADSFIVYFERIRDELRDGESSPARSRPAGSARSARSTSPKVVNILAAVVLYSSPSGT